MTEKTDNLNATIDQRKKAYRAPVLINHGSIADVTRQQTDKLYFGNDGNTQCTGDANAAPRPCS
jgi:hypothetical protein